MGQELKSAETFDSYLVQMSVSLEICDYCKISVNPPRRGEGMQSILKATKGA